MKNRPILSIIICLGIATAILIPALTYWAGAGSPVEVTILFNGEDFIMDSPGIIMDAVAYVPILDFCKVMDPGCSVSEDDSNAIIVSGMQISAIEGKSYIIANERYLYVPTLCKSVGNAIYVPVHSIALAFGLAVTWLDNTNTIALMPEYGPIESGDTYYDEMDVYWMSRIINAEAGGEPMAGKIAVGNVIMNRIDSRSYPDTVYDVVFDFRHGIQFTPAYTGVVNRAPNQDSIIAAKLAFEGADVVGDSLFFNATWVINSWASVNRQYVTTIGGHAFYS